MMDPARAARFACRSLAAIAIVAAIGTLMTAGSQYFGHSRSVDIDEPNSQFLSIREEDLLIDSKWSQKEFAKTVSIHNHATFPIEVVRLNSSCDCTSVVPRTFAVPAAGKQDVELRIRLGEVREPSELGVLETVDIELMATLRDGTHSNRWRLSGTIGQPLAFLPSYVYFPLGELNDSESPFPGKEIKVVRNTGIQSVVAVCDPNMADVTFEPADSATVTSQKLRVVPSDTLPIGPFDFKVDFRVTDEDGEEFLAPPLSVRGVVVDDLELLPPQIRFSHGRLGETLEQVLVMRSRRRDEFRIVSVEVPTDEIDVQLDNKEAKSQHILTVRRQVTKVGFNKDVVLLRVRSGAQVRELEFEISYKGLDG